MDRLWAPWRMKYIRSKQTKRCIFCKADYVVIRSKYSLSLLNIYPYNNGHIMVCPKRHIKDIQHLNKEEVWDLFATIIESISLLNKTIKPAGYNIGINVGAISGAGVVGHLHIHIVPRWKGDTNFMPLISGTKVISQSIEELFKKLRDAKSRTTPGI